MNRTMISAQRLLDPTFRSAWFRLVRLWRPLAAWTFLTWILAGICVTPLLSAGLSRLILRGDRILIGNTELLGWMLTPEGLAYLTLAGAVFLLGTVIRYAGLFRIVTDDLYGSPPSIRQTLLSLILQAPALFRLCLLAMVAALLILVPLVAGLGAVYAIWLGEHDINYYLDAQPPEWRRAQWAVALLAIPWAIGAGYLILRSLPTLPAFLSGNRLKRAALAHSWNLTHKNTFRLMRLLLLCFGAWWLARAVAQATLLFIASTGIELMAGWISSVLPILIATGVYTLAAVALDIVISFFGFSFTAIVLTKFYYEDTGTCIAVPQPSHRFAGIPRGGLDLLRGWLRPSRLLPVVGVLLLMSGSISGWFLHQVPRDPHFVVSAHRAGAFLAPENTLAALEAAIDTGADYAEIDVQRTRDGVIVVLHDADLMRVAGDPRRIADTDFADFADLRQGGDTDIAPELVRLATLEDFLEHARGRIRLQIEFKHYGWDPELIPETVNLIREMEMEEEVVLMSLELRAVREARALAPEIPVGFVASISMGNMRQLPVDFLAVSRNLATPRLIRDAHERDMEVHIWTLNRADTILDAIQRGADGVITDDPLLAVRIREELASMNALERILLLFRDLMPEVELVEAIDADS